MYFFTEIADPQRLARVADAWPRDAAIGRPGQVCDPMPFTCAWSGVCCTSRVWPLSG